MKDIDIKVLNILRDDSRTSFTKLSRSLNVPITTLFTRFQNFNIITGFKSLIDFKRLGYFLNVLFIVDFDKNVLRFFKKSNVVNTLQVCGVDRKIFVNCIFKSFSDFKDFNKEIIKLNFDVMFSHYFLEPVSLERFKIKEKIKK
jgi:DNA-binding Lrp family transcriptional regulator